MLPQLFCCCGGGEKRSNGVRGDFLYVELSWVVVEIQKNKNVSEKFGVRKINVFRNFNVYNLLHNYGKQNASRDTHKANDYWNRSKTLGLQWPTHHLQGQSRQPLWPFSLQLPWVQGRTLESWCPD